VRDRLREPFVLLDWGCGDGRLFNFLSKRFRTFKYFGLERPGLYGDKCIQAARSSFGHDARAEFDVYDTETETRAAKEAGVAIMGSVATHITFDAFEGIMDRILPVLERGGVLVASFFIEEKYEAKYGTRYGHEDCLGWVSYRQDQIDDLCWMMGLKSEPEGVFVADGMGNIHRMIRFLKVLPP